MCSLVLTAGAEAGAWTKRKYEGLFIGGVGLHWLDPHDLPANHGHRKLEYSAYLEFGLTDRITLVGRGGYQELSDRLRPAKSKPLPPRTGFGGLEAGVRVGLMNRGRWASSAQVMAGIPGSGENWINEEFGARGGDVDLRLQLGRAVGEGAFIEASTGVRLRGEEAADELRLDLTAGADFLFGTDVMIQTYSVWSLGNPIEADRYTGHRVQTSLLVPVGEANTLQFSALTSFSQQRMSEEFAVTFSLWRSF